MSVHFQLKIWLFLLLSIIFSDCKVDRSKMDVSKQNKEDHRPEYHFTPDSMWMNDPNGMVYYEGEYHLFYQYYPDSTVWGPMHWGHAVSTDMIKWEHLPIALYPDSLGYIFSGSAVIDWDNTSGWGKDGVPPMVAIYTYHNIDGERSGKNDFQYQGVAYSLDKGRTWTKYDKNPVIPNPGIKDFRDPKVIWHPETQRWIMVLAVKDRAMFYSSPDLKIWSKESEYGIKNETRLWECPDLFEMKVEGSEETKWVLVISMQTGAPNGGTGTSYFIGDFDGHTFSDAFKTQKQYWLDYGTDNYAMVSWSDIPKIDGRRLMLGWMSNWQYAQIVPTQRWRSAMTLPRQIKLFKDPNGEYKLKSQIVNELSVFRKDTVITSKDEWISNHGTLNLDDASAFELEITFEKSTGLQLYFTSELRDTLGIGYLPIENQWYIDRRKAGKADFYSEFGAIHKAPALTDGPTCTATIFLDRASVELFADDGFTTMTDIFFPRQDLNKVFTMKPEIHKSIKRVVLHRYK